MVHHSSSANICSAFQCPENPLALKTPHLKTAGTAFCSPPLPWKAEEFVGPYGGRQSQCPFGISLFPLQKRRRRRKCRSQLLASPESRDKDTDNETKRQNTEDKMMDDEKAFLERELKNVESLEDILEELESFGGIDDEDEEEDDYYMDDWDEDTLEELFLSLPEEDLEDFLDEIGNEADDDETYLNLNPINKGQSASLLENALLQGVVPVSAGVGSDCLPGDFGFDPLNLASKDYFPKAQTYIRDLIPTRDGSAPQEKSSEPVEPRPPALILRDYREAEIRHGRLAMLAAVFWPLQELLDRLVLDEDQFDSLLHSLFNGGVTLPYFPLLMTAIMLLLGYLDIYSQAIKDMDKIGEAFLPGDCFWDPLQILAGAPDRMKRNMQERELFNGRFAMIAIAAYIWEEARTGKPVVSIEGNDILFEPAYQVPVIQKWLDSQFASKSPLFYNIDEDELFNTITSVDIWIGKAGDLL